MPPQISSTRPDNSGHARKLLLGSVAILAALSFLFAGCGGKDKESKKPKEDKKSQEKVDKGAEQITKKMPSTEVLGVDTQFKAFIDLVKKANLQETLDNEKELTLFVPNSDAFKALGDDALADLEKNPEDLAKYLKRYVVKGTHDLAELVNMGDDGELETLAGNKAKVNTDDKGNTTFDGATLIKFNIATSNATIHVMDKALEP